MRILLVFLVVIALALGGGHYVIWQQQSALFEQQVNNIVEKLNQEAGAEAVRFTYESKETGNYPESSVTYINPKLTIDSSFYNTKDAQPAAMTVNEISIDGKLTITNSFLQNKTMVEATGSSFISGTDMGAPYALKTSWDDAYRCSLTSADSPISFLTGESKIDKAESPAEFIKAMESFECTINNVKMVNALHNRPLMDIAAYRLHVDSRPADAPLHHIGVDMQVEDALFYYSKEDYLNDIEMMLSSPDALEASILAALRQRDTLPLFDSSLAGKNDMRLRGYAETDLDKEEPLPFTLDLQEATITNELYTMEFPLYVEVKGNNSVTIRHTGVNRFTEAYDAVLRDSLDMIIEVASDPSLALDAEMREKIENLDVDALRNLLPPFHEAGDIRTLVNLSVEGGQTADIKQLGLETALYGITASGKVNAATNQVQNGVLTCTNCEGLITRLVNYGNHISRVMASIGEASQDMMISDAAAQALIGFVAQLDTNKEDNNVVTVTLESDANGMPVVSGQPAMMVMMQAMTTLAPHFPFLMPDMSQGGMAPAPTPSPEAEGEE